MSRFASTSIAPTAAAEFAANIRITKYSDFAEAHHFTSMTVETGCA
jgi:hypothetical protein